MTAFDIVALAKRINQRREEWNRLHPDAPLRVSSVMSRILENDPDYIPYRPRVEGKRRRGSSNPSVRTLAAIADVLETTVGDLLGEPSAPALSLTERKRLRLTLRDLAKLV